MPNHLHLIIVIFSSVSCRDVSQKHLYDNNDETNKHFSDISPKK